MPDVTVLLTSFKRPQNLRPQLDAVRNQTITPARIVVFHNGSNVKPDVATLKIFEHVYCSQNTGVWARFYHCLNFDTEYVLVLDDDTIPGKRALEVMLEALEQTGGVIGGNGVIFDEGKRENRRYIGLDGHRDEPARTDIVGHAWLFMRDWLHDYCATKGFGTRTCGEDYHWSFVTGNNCWVPRRDLTDAETWVSLNPHLGTDEVALYRQSGEEEKKAICHQQYLDAGWKTLFHLQQESLNENRDRTEAIAEPCDSPA